MKAKRALSLGVVLLLAIFFHFSASAQNCSYSISPSSQSFGPAGGPATVNVTASGTGGASPGGGDLWADVVIGQRSFNEISPNEIVPYRLFNPGGVTVDRSVSPGRAYVWDSGNNRILGFDLGQCYAHPSQPCTASVVIGQPSGNDYGACNGDSSFRSYPQRVPASAATLCTMWEGTATVLEDKTFVAMFTDSAGNLYVPDIHNHRVLKYKNPFTSDGVADEVWGQDDFSGNQCNKTGDIVQNIYPSPTSSSLCFFRRDVSMGAGVALDGVGNLWIADGGNNRVLRFSKDAYGNIGKTANLVLGQPDFTSSAVGSALNQMSGPNGLRFDASGRLYVADSSNHRILVFVPHPISGFSSGMAATGTLGTGLQNPLGVEIDPAGHGVFVLDQWGVRVKLLSFEGNLIRELPPLYDFAGSSLGIDTQGNILVSEMHPQDVFIFKPQADGNYLLSGSLLQSGGQPNSLSNRRLINSAWVGMAVAGDQLIVADTRLLFWNGLSTLSDGKPADGYVGANSFYEIPSYPHFSQIKADTDNRIWATRGMSIEVYQAPLTTGAQPIKTLSTIPLLGGGQISLYHVSGLVPTPQGEFLWVTEHNKHRVMRIRDPLTNPMVDVILGQKTILPNDTGYECNRGEVPRANSWDPSKTLLRDMLCSPGSLGLDKKGNLYVSDHFIESDGNWRMLMFAPDLFPQAPNTMIFAPMATKEFPPNRPPAVQTHMTWEPAFDSTNRMVVGYNPISGSRFVKYYNDPTRVNPADPSDYNYAVPDGQLKDFDVWPIAMTFDQNDNLYVYEANRSQVRIYRHPFGPPPVGSCNWTAVSNAGWITLTSSSSNSGSGAVNYTVAANTASAARTGTMTIAGQTFTASQSGQVSSGSVLVISDKVPYTWYFGSSYSRLRQAQTFKATGSAIQEVSVAMIRVGQPAESIQVTIRPTLTGTILASATISPSQVTSTDGTNPTWVKVAFPTPAQVTVGSTYYLVLSVSRPDAYNYYRVGYNDQNPYADGQWYLDTTPYPNYDMACTLTFGSSTFPPPPPPPGPGGNVLTITDKVPYTWYLGSSYSRLRQAQTFKAIGSKIQEVSVAMIRVGQPTQSIQVSIRPTLTGTVLASATISPSQVTSTDGRYPTWVKVTFPTPANVTAGSTYYLVLTVSSPDAYNYYRVGYNDQDPYADGMWYLDTTAYSNIDMACTLTFQ